MATDLRSLPLEIDVDDLSNLRADGTPHAILDVREPWEVEICGFEDAILVPMASLPGRLSEVPRDDPVIIVCHHGYRSLVAAEFMRRAGHPAASSLRGGLDAWASTVDPKMARY